MSRCFCTTLSFCVVMRAIGSKHVVSCFENESNVVTRVPQQMTNNSNADYRCIEEQSLAAFCTLEVLQSLELSWQGDSWLNV